jgi:hypothetical protein
MLLLTHIFIAVLSLVASAAAVVSPSANRILVAYGLVGGTIASGVALAWTNPAVIVHACVMGLIFVSISLGGITVARKKLAAA